MKTDKQIVLQTFKYFSKYKSFILLAVLAGALSAGCGVISSELVRKVIDGLEAGTLTDIYKVILMCTLVLIAGAGSAWILRYTSGYAATMTLKDIKNDAVKHISELSADFMAKNHSGDILSRLTDDVNRISDFVQNDLIVVIMNPFILFFYLVYLLYLNPILFLISIVPTAICLPLGSSLTTKFKAGSKAYMQETANVISKVSDMIGGIEVVKSYSLQDTLFSGYHKNVKKLTDMAVKNDGNQYKGRVFFILSGTVSSILCLAAGGWFCLNGSLTLGGLVAFFSLLPKATEIINDISYRFFNSKVAFAAAERVFGILQAPTEPSGTVESGMDSAPAIEFRDVSFSYDERVPVLNGISFRIQKGKTVAVVGTSGGGKSTLLRLICGFYRPQSGSILIEGVDIDEWNLKALRLQLSYVSQHAFLFPVSVEENISMGKPGADKEDIHIAAEAANAAGFIDELPEKYETLAGERGARLSGGQIQRIAIARGILKDAPILLLDEATSALDTQAEVEVQSALDALSEGRTVFVVAHRLSTIRNADCILVMDKGQIAESGTHDELMSHGKVYPQLYSVYSSGKEAVS